MKQGFESLYAVQCDDGDFGPVKKPEARSASAETAVYNHMALPVRIKPAAVIRKKLNIGREYGSDEGQPYHSAVKVPGQR